MNFSWSSKDIVKKSSTAAEISDIKIQTVFHLEGILYNQKCHKLSTLWHFDKLTKSRKNRNKMVICLQVPKVIFPFRSWIFFIIAVYFLVPCFLISPLIIFIKINILVGLFQLVPLSLFPFNIRIFNKHIRYTNVNFKVIFHVNFRKRPSRGILLFTFSYIEFVAIEIYSKWNCFQIMLIWIWMNLKKNIFHHIYQMFKKWLSFGEFNSYIIHNDSPKNLLNCKHLKVSMNFVWSESK